MMMMMADLKAHDEDAQCVQNRQTHFSGNISLQQRLIQHISVWMTVRYTHTHSRWMIRQMTWNFSYMKMKKSFWKRSSFSLRVNSKVDVFGNDDIMRMCIPRYSDFFHGGVRLTVVVCVRVVQAVELLQSYMHDARPAAGHGESLRAPLMNHRPWSLQTPDTQHNLQYHNTTHNIHTHLTYLPMCLFPMYLNWWRHTLKTQQIHNDTWACHFNVLYISDYFFVCVCVCGTYSRRLKKFIRSVGEALFQ